MLAVAEVGVYPPPGPNLSNGGTFEDKNLLRLIAGAVGVTYLGDHESPDLFRPQYSEVAGIRIGIRCCAGPARLAASRFRDAGRSEKGPYAH